MSESITVQVHPSPPFVDHGSETKVDDSLVHHVVSSLKAKIDQGRLEDGSSKAIRKAMEVASTFAVKGAQKKTIVLKALNLLSAHAPDRWAPTISVASTQVDELFKIAQGLSSLNKNSTLADVKVQLAAFAQSKAVASCFPCFKKK